MPDTPPIDHVIVVALENRSFDHMLGFLDHPDPTYDGLLHTPVPHTNPGVDGTDVPAMPTAKTVLPIGPDHSHDAAVEQLAVPDGSAGQPTNQGFVTSYDRICRGHATPKFSGLVAPLLNWLQGLKKPAAPVTGRGPLVMKCQPPAQVPVLATLALEFAVFTRWFCSVPGETWPNRNFLHAATSDGETDIDPRPYTNKTIFEVLEETGKTWRIYYDDTPQVWAFQELWDTDERRANWHEFDAFTQHVAAGDLPSYSFIEPNHRPALHNADHSPVIGSPAQSNSQHPGNNLVANTDYDAYPPGEPNDFTRGEGLLAAIYEALRANPEVFARTLLLITYDEHGGFYDHVPPPTDVPNPGTVPGLLRRLMHALYHRRAKAFDFQTLGFRVPAVAVSPFIEAGTVDATVRDHAAVPSTLRWLFAPTAVPLTTRDAWSPPFHTVINRTSPRNDLPDLSAHAAARTVPPTDAVAGEAIPIGAHVPRHYDPFVKLADHVQRKLRHKGAAAGGPIRGLPALQRAQITTQTFAAAARASRQNQATLTDPSAR